MSEQQEDEMEVRRYLNQVLGQGRRGGPRYDEACRDFDQMTRDRYRAL